MGEESSFGDKRRHRRHRRRFTLRFDDGSGNGDGGRLAFTEDISRQGLFVKTANVARPGAKILVILILPGGEVRMEGRVMWGKKVQPAFLQKVNKAGMGVRILGFQAGEELYRALCDELEVP